MESFAERLKLLEEFGIPAVRATEYRGDGADRHRVDLDLFQGVTLPFSDEEWCELCQREGVSYLGGCCASLDSVQSTIQEVFRDNGYISCQTLDEIIETLHHHGDFDFDEDPVPLREADLNEVIKAARNGWANFYPWKKLAVIWHITKGYFTIKQPDGPFGDHVAPLDQAISTLREGLHYLSLSRFFHTTEGRITSSTSEVQHQASNMLATARILPALKTLNEHISELKLDPVYGFVIVDLEVPDQPLHNGFGVCFYLDDVEVRRMAESWRKTDETYQDAVCKPLLRKLGMRKALVSVERGLEFQDDGPTPISVYTEP